MSAARPEARIESVSATAYTIPTDAPESDGTLEWASTTLIVVEARGGGQALWDERHRVQ